MPPTAIPRFNSFLRSLSETFSSCSPLKRNSNQHALSTNDQKNSMISRNPHLVLPNDSPLICADDGQVEVEVDEFSPTPIDTSQMILPDCIRDLKDILAENLHEVWAMNKIDAGWKFAKERDDVQKKHPCITNYEALTETEKDYDVTLTMETLKTLSVLGYQISQDTTPTQKPSVINLPENYRQSNGYKPKPFDLSSIKLDEETEDLIDVLAANLHDIWAKNRIQQGWSYGNSEDNMCKRSPHLLPYDKIDWTIKKANRDSVLTIVKSLIAFGSDLRPPVDRPPVKLTRPHQRFLSITSVASSTASPVEENPPSTVPGFKI